MSRLTCCVLQGQVRCARSHFPRRRCACFGLIHVLSLKDSKLTLHDPFQYRVIVPDLPSHGRSSGIHVYLPSMEALADAIYAVLEDTLLEDSKLVKESDGSISQARKVFVAGQSLGGGQLSRTLFVCWR